MRGREPSLSPSASEGEIMDEDDGAPEDPPPTLRSAAFAGVLASGPWASSTVGGELRASVPEGAMQQAPATPGSSRSARSPREPSRLTTAGEPPQDRSGECTTALTGGGLGGGITLDSLQSFLKGVQDLLSAGGGSGSPVGVWGSPSVLPAPVPLCACWVCAWRTPPGAKFMSVLRAPWGPI